MGFFKKHTPWSPEDIPDMAFSGPTDFVDIGFLGGEEHQQAFVKIFEKMLRDNRSTLEAYELIGIDSKKPVSLDVELPTAILEISSSVLGLKLYQSYNTKLYLRLSEVAGDARLGMSFDNPSFWFEKIA